MTNRLWQPVSIQSSNAFDLQTIQIFEQVANNSNNEMGDDTLVYLVSTRNYEQKKFTAGGAVNVTCHVTHSNLLIGVLYSLHRYWFGTLVFVFYFVNMEVKNLVFSFEVVPQIFERQLGHWTM